jgi:hypothetical protein
MKEVIDATLSKLAIKDITNILSKTEIEASINVGDIICVQGAHNFKSLSKGYKPGLNQSARGVRKVNGVKIEYLFDLWEATSSSSRACHLSGRQSATSICFVKNIQSQSDMLILHCSVLLIGSAFANLQTRAYGSYPSYGMRQANYNLNLNNEEEGLDQEF